VTTFSGNEHPVPRYDYNQLMYRLDLDHPGLADVRQAYDERGQNGRGVTCSPAE
jgi:hypothetical protein